MWINSKEAWASLRSIVSNINADPSVSDDLFQEALLHLWLEEALHPGNTLSWHLQSCSLHLRNHLRKGRSIDSPKRRSHSRLASDFSSELSTDGEELSLFDEVPDPGSDIISSATAKEAFDLLLRDLSPCDQKILNALLDGLNMREIASRLHLSHATISNRRRKIAALSARLGLLPNSKSGFQQIHRNTCSVNRSGT